MQRPASYHTKQKDAVLTYILSLGNTHVTAGQIVRHFETEASCVGRTTIFRLLEKMVQEGTLRKYRVDGISGACYQHVPAPDAKPRLLLKCEDCGELTHLDCKELEEIHHHILQDHTFRVNPGKTVFYGKCEVCLSTRPDAP